MPRFDGKGPCGRRRTGRSLGPCGKGPRADYINESGGKEREIEFLNRKLQALEKEKTSILEKLRTLNET